MTRTPIHPGEHLAQELRGLRISAAEAARHLDLPEKQVSEILSGEGRVTSDIAARLADWFGTSAQFWLNLQRLYDLHLAQRP
jgi:antitoxin HigA-1